MLGFAKNGDTTGGFYGPIVYITNLNELHHYITDTKPRTLVISENIFAPQKTVLILGANKSLIGSWNANIINNVYFYSSPRSENIIFQNLYFKHDIENIENGETQLILVYGQRYWIDHCTFDGDIVNENDLGKLLKVSGNVDYVTLSNSKFMNHMYGLILGYPDDDPSLIEQYDNYPRMSIMFNFFDNIHVRAPGLMRFGKYHVYNNYINNYHLGFTIGFQSKIYSEYNYFSDSGVNNAVLDDKGNGYFKDVGSKNMPNNQKSKTTSWYPSSDYSYVIRDPEYSREFCTKFSGSQNQELVFGGGS
ncbi:pectin lyase-like [Belonocnema kinseyi]|uniref:pectin lyase-like n=1 Tax=Belonocnema kinseyi TaxID=2817044 RepID=UPI00143DF9DC|nr:pectin lyase-like [Belonocnema kinseyi]